MACLIGTALAACDQGLTPPPTTSSASPTIPTQPSAGSPDASAPAGISQTDTDWGRIWDGLPQAFPLYPGATPADDAATELVSATFVLSGPDARTVATWMQTELERATFATEALNGPLEDGSFILDSTGSGDCRIQVAIAPTGGLTRVSVRYGAACPSP
jgi:hypothetical protein